ncbi:unnamed protein product [Wuchereria bancrofti]|uniref:Uncharacterized protein n=1 Tax=Wuchereria bancrofti TaxID=6293 RepID=A0A3P7FJD7_WUCBA|nr:unnamed protein product [Wuchereria bancrofti]
MQGTEISLKKFEAMYILLLGIITNAFASILTQQNSSEVLEQIVFYLLNISSFYDINSTNLEWNMLKYLMHPKAVGDVIFEASKIAADKFVKNWDTYIYSSALIGMLSVPLTIMLVVLLNTIFKHSSSWLHLVGIKQTSKQSNDKAMLIQSKSLDHNMDIVLV